MIPQIESKLHWVFWEVTCQPDDPEGGPIKTRQEKLDELETRQIDDLEEARAQMESLYQQLGGTVTEDVTAQIKRFIRAILRARDLDLTEAPLTDAIHGLILPRCGVVLQAVLDTAFVVAVAHIRTMIQPSFRRFTSPFIGTELYVSNLTRWAAQGPPRISLADPGAARIMTAP